MKLILFSNPDNGVIDKLELGILPKNRKNIFGYMPADGKNPKPQYLPFWKEFAARDNAEFIEIDNSKKPNVIMLEELKRINSLFISGGNVFNLLHNIRTNGYDKIIRELSRKEDFIYSGFSAGAIIATPNVRIASKEHGWSFGYDENKLNITDTRALGFVDFEMLPHYNPKHDKAKLESYQKKFGIKVKPLMDEEFIVLERQY